MPTTSYMGGQVRRREDPRLITGRATYVDDMKLPGMAYMAVLRSPFPHARIGDIDASAALEMPGVIAVVTGDEVQHLVPPQQGEQEGESGPPPRAPLATGRALYIGDPVAAVVAEDRATAEDAIENIVVDWEELPSVGDPEAAMQDGAPQVQEYAKNNIDTERPFSAGDVDRAFSEAEATISVRMTNQRLVPNPMETRGVVATYNVGNGQFTVWSSTQAAHFVRDAICEAFGLPQTKVRCICPEVGGGFGCKIGAYPEDVLAAYLAQKLERPIKWIETRTEHFQATVQGRSQIAYVELAAKRDGTVTGLKMRLIADSGAYGAGWSAETTAGMITGCYDIRNIETNSYTVLTNKTPLGAYRGAGRPEAAYFIERAMDLLADELSMDPADVRRKNFIAPSNFPYDLVDWPKFDSGEYATALDAALERSEVAQVRAEQERLRGEGRLVGVGFASYVEVCGFGWETATVRVEADGTVSIYTGISPHGQGQETTFAQMAADVLGVEPDQVNVLYGDTAMGPGHGTMGSRGTAVGGPAVMAAATQLREKMQRLAAQMMEAAPEDLELGDGVWQVKGVPDRNVSVAEVVQKAYGGGKLPEDMEPGLIAVNNFRPGGLTAPFGTHVACVEVDRETGSISILRFLTVDDCGTIISPKLVQGQVHGGAGQGISQALYEEAVFDENGQLLTSSFVDYAIPTIADLPMYETTHTHTPTPYNDMGIKGIGEAATVGSTPCVVNAVMDALSPLGIRHIDMPLTPDKVWKAIQDAEGGGKNAAG